MKRIGKRLASSPKAIERFLSEAKAVASLNHLNIVQVHDVDEDEHGHFLTMELVEGEDLRAKIQRDGRLDPEQAVHIARQLNKALTYAHQRGVIHRDIKPGNVLIDRQGTPKLVDFGLARVIDPDGPALTRTGAMLGTPDYASPEQLEDAKVVDSRTDVYSLGATLYEMLTGESPRRMDVAKVPQEVRHCVTKATAAKPEQRYQSAEEFERALGEIVFGDVLALIAKAEVCEHKGDLEGALEKYERVLLKKPDHAQALERLPQLRVRIKGLAEARDEARASASRADWEAAAEAWERVLTIAPGDAESRQQLAKARSEIRNTRLSEAIEKARRHLEEGNLQSAQSQCQCASELDPGNPMVAEIRQAVKIAVRGLRDRKIKAGMQAFNERNYDATILLLTESLELMRRDHPERPKLVQAMNLAQACQWIKEADEAIERGDHLEANALLARARGIGGKVRHVVKRIARREERIKEAQALATHRKHRRNLVIGAAGSASLVLVLAAALCLVFTGSNERLPPKLPIPPPGSGTTQPGKHNPSEPITDSGIPSELGPDKPTRKPVVPPFPDNLRCVNVPAEWNSVDESTRQKVLAARARKTKGLTEYSVSSILRRMQPSVPLGGRPSGPRQTKLSDETEQQLPKRFLLSGSLALLRVFEGKTWIFLAGPMDGAAPFVPAFVGAPVPSSIAIVFEPASLGQLLCDYRRGDSVVAAVELKDWGQFTGADLSKASPIPAVPWRPQAPGMTLPIPAALAAGFRAFAGGYSPGNQAVVRFCLAGSGIEKAGLADTWVDVNGAEATRAAILSNPEAVNRSPGSVYRVLGDRIGWDAVLRGKYQIAAETDGCIVADVLIGDGREPEILVRADLGSEARLKEFLDNGYAEDTEVELRMRLGEPKLVRGAKRGLGDRIETTPEPGMPSPMLQNPMGPRGAPAALERDPMTAWDCVSGTCEWIRIVGRADSAIVRTGPRNLAAGPTGATATQPAPVTPDDVYVDPNGKLLGQTVTWTGTLHKIRVLSDGLHLLIGVSESKMQLRLFEAYTANQELVNQMDDYWSEEEGTRTASLVRIEGVVRSANGVLRLSDSKKAPLIEVKALERVGTPNFRIMPGQQRNPSTLVGAQSISSAQKLWRNYPRPDEERGFAAVYEDYNAGDRRVRAKSGHPADWRMIYIRFPASSQADFSDYAHGDRVNLVAHGTAEAGSREMVLEGLSIVRAKNPRSRVTTTGREFPPIDTETAERRYSELKVQMISGGARDGERVLLVGGYEGVKQAGDFRTFTIKRGYQTEDFSCAASPELDKFFAEHGPGTEVLLEVVVVAAAEETSPLPGVPREQLDSRRSRRGSPRAGIGGANKQKLEPSWIAWIGEPDKRILLRSSP
jgi:tetratricopeptide (TPR) repeat protein